MRSLVGSLGLVLALVGCKDDRPSPGAAPVRADAAAEGKRAIAELKGRLVGRLTEALKVSPASAIEVCNVEAPAIAASLGSGGVTVGRATRKPRNPANLAAGWQADALAHFEALAGAGSLDGASWSKTLADGSTAYAEPLLIQPLCVTCHGPTDRLAPEVAQALAARYPADQATGYAAGDLRGIAWASIPARPR